MTTIWKFSSKSCGPCKTLAKVLEKDYPELPIIEVVLDDLPEYAEKYKIRGVPTLIKLNKDAVELARLEGYKPGNSLKEFLHGSHE